VISVLGNKELHMKKLRFAVILAGCGNKDGSEIHESVLTLLAIDKAGHHYQCFAPDISQERVLNFLTNEELPKRNVLVEAARIARSNIKALSEYNVADVDVLVMPGGFGVAYNLCTFATQGADMTVNADVARAVLSTHEAKKPIGALCIAPVIIGKLIPGATLTFGEDEKVNSIFEKIGTTVVYTTPVEIIIDKKNKIVTTPCYMHADARVSELAQGIDKAVNALIQLV
jgi:enhancing lycopene biosynthesis protein 2